MFALMGSILSHSLMRDGKKEYYKQSVLQSIEVNLSGFLEKTLLLWLWIDLGTLLTYIK